MKKYTVEWKETYSFETEIEAENYEEALAKADHIACESPSFDEGEWHLTEDEDGDLYCWTMVEGVKVVSEYEHLSDFSCIPDLESLNKLLRSRFRTETIRKVEKPGKIINSDDE